MATTTTARGEGGDALPAAPLPYAQQLREHHTQTQVSLLDRLVDHCAYWVDRGDVVSVDGQESSATMLTWWMCATALENTTDDPRALRDFPLVDIHECWEHDDYIPITRMNMQHMMDTLEALEWHVFSDMFFHGRTDEWWQQVMALFKLLLTRAYQFTQGASGWHLSILNVEEYRTVTTINLLDDDDQGEGGEALDDYTKYESGGEEEEGGDKGSFAPRGAPPPGKSSASQAESKKRRARLHRALYGTKKLKEDAEEKRKKEMGDEEKKAEADKMKQEAEEEAKKFKTKLASVSLVWLYDIDTITGYFWQEAFEHEKTGITPRIPSPPELGTIRNFLFENARACNKEVVVRFRRVWYDDLIVTASHLRIYKRKSPLSLRPASREVMIYKNETLYVTHCTSVDDITMKLVDGDIDQMWRINTDAMFFFFATSLSDKDVCKAVYCPTRRECTSYPSIYRNRIRNHWELAMNANTRFQATSFTAAFAYMRVWMRQHKVSSMKGSVPLDVMDEYFFPGQK